MEKNKSTHKNYRQYSSYLTNLIKRTKSGELDREDKNNISKALDGESYVKLTQYVSLEDIRSLGAFFTSSKLRKLAINRKLKVTNNGDVFLDPACGSGDLLIACANSFEIKTSLEETLFDWGKRLIGRDINPYFINVTRQRIALAAIEKGAKSINKNLALSDLLPNIKVGNSLNETNIYSLATQIVINPPYYLSIAPTNCNYGKGKINISTLFIERCVNYSKNNTNIIAILPDVLRSGTRYEKWREFISSKISIIETEIYGRFDEIADVDVFVLVGEKKSQNTKVNINHEWCNLISTERIVSDKFHVHVGPHVPFRHDGLGSWHKYIHARNISSWEIMTKFEENIRFTGRTFKPPFVVIKRTSRPDERYRAIGAIINHKSSFAVENHLVVCVPKDGKLQACKELLELLKNNKTSDWLDSRIRCRHLTTASIKDIPWITNVRLT